MNYLSVAKVRQHGHSDKRWTVGDKITQYKGAINLLVREKNARDEQDGNQLRNQTRDLKRLQRIVRSKREQLEQLFARDRQLVESVLIHHKDLRLACRRLRPDQITEAGVQSNYTMRRKLDVIAFRLKKKEEELKGLLIEIGDIKHSILFAVEQKIPTEMECKRITGKVQEMNLLKEAAISVHSKYAAIRDILCKDRIYYDNLLENLVQNQLEQNRCMMRVTILGQVACEKFDDKRTECSATGALLDKISRLEKHKNSTRAFIVELDENVKRLVRKEGSEVVESVDLVHQEKVDALNDDIECVRAQLDDLQEAILVTRYEDIITTMLSQSSVRKRILLLKEHMLKTRRKLRGHIDRLSERSNRIRCTSSDADIEYRSRKEELQSSIKGLTEKSRDISKRKEVKCELLAEISKRLLHLKACMKHLCVSSSATMARSDGNLLNLSALQPIAAKVRFLKDNVDGSVFDDKSPDVDMLEHYSRYIAGRSTVHVRNFSAATVKESPSHDEDVKLDEVPSRKAIKLQSEHIAETSKSLEP